MIAPIERNSWSKLLTFISLPLRLVHLARVTDAFWRGGIFIQTELCAEADRTNETTLHRTSARASVSKNSKEHRCEPMDLPERGSRLSAIYRMVEPDAA